MKEKFVVIFNRIADMQTAGSEFDFP